MAGRVFGKIVTATVQYSEDSNASMSSWRSLISLKATDCTLPAEIEEGMTLSGKVESHGVYSSCNGAERWSILICQEVIRQRWHETSFRRGCNSCCWFFMMCIVPSLVIKAIRCNLDNRQWFLCRLTALVYHFKTVYFALTILLWLLFMQPCTSLDIMHETLSIERAIPWVESTCWWCSRQFFPEYGRDLETHKVVQCSSSFVGIHQIWADPAWGFQCLFHGLHCHLREGYATHMHSIKFTLHEETI